jgi:hypothetical protein
MIALLKNVRIFAVDKTKKSLRGEVEFFYFFSKRKINKSVCLLFNKVKIAVQRKGYTIFQAISL